MFNSFKKFWDKYGFEIIVAVSIVFILIFALIRKNKNGSWSKKYYIPTANKKNNNSPSIKTPPKDSKGERECRRVLQKLFNKPFNNERPNFLNNPVTGGLHNLELDCYNESLRLAVEYSGKQHYEYNSFMHRSKDAFYNQKYRDELKSRMCKDNNVRLIVVSYKVKNEDIEGYLIRELVKMGYNRYFV